MRQKPRWKLFVSIFQFVGWLASCQRWRKFVKEESSWNFEALMKSRLRMLAVIANIFLVPLAIMVKTSKQLKTSSLQFAAAASTPLSSSSSSSSSPLSSSLGSNWSAGSAWCGGAREKCLALPHSDQVIRTLFHHAHHHHQVRLDRSRKDSSSNPQIDKL